MADVNLWPGFAAPADVRNVATGASSGGSASYTVSVSDTAGATDAATRGHAATRAVVDTLAPLGEVVTHVQSFTRAVADVAGATDVAARAFSAVAAAVDAAVAGDASARYVSAARATIEVTTVGDAAAAYRTLTRTASDTVPSLGEAVSYAVQYARDDRVFRLTAGLDADHTTVTLVGDMMQVTMDVNHLTALVDVDHLSSVMDAWVRTATMDIDHITLGLDPVPKTIRTSIGDQDVVGCTFTDTSGATITGAVFQLALGTPTAPVAPWVTVTPTVINQSSVHLQALVGAGGVLNPPVGSYRLWARMVLAPETVSVVSSDVVTIA